MTRQPTKQRNQTARAPLHERQRQVRATLSDDLREEYGKRNVRVNVGDIVEVMRGDFAGEEGEVIKVDLKKVVIHVEGVTIEKADGEEVPRALDTSNVRVTELNLEDDVRETRLEADNE
ncbi:50S ribosomal protein L24 [Haladaptatus sp. GCM10025707]|uniref:50S ribosomal protein L24 n=1 Tax=unclassified Haladaptatus TaxID=2622732 RepID=UPI0023E8ED57|nr:MULTISPECIES: 50S ribosomal protein L24 [unclassified Haladaptatus]